MLYANVDITRWTVGKAKLCCQSRVDFALHEFILMFMAGLCIPAVPHVDIIFIDVWLKLLRITWLGLATPTAEFEIASVKRNSISFYLSTWQAVDFQLVEV